MKTIIIIGLGFLFGSVLIASEAFHWYRIQQMFHFDSFHMYGILFSAIGTGVLSLWMIKRCKIKSIRGEEISLKKKERDRYGNILGGLLFGSGWALSGACTAPIFILLGLQWGIGIVLLTGSLGGVLLYALFKSKILKQK